MDPFFLSLSEDIFFSVPSTVKLLFFCAAEEEEFALVVSVWMGIILRFLAVKFGDEDKCTPL